jgi:hypothetical protein
MSCGHDGCTCGSEQSTTGTHLPTVEHADGPRGGSHCCGGHGSGDRDRDGCCRERRDRH